MKCLINLLPTVLLLAAATCDAAPSYQEARKVYNQIEKLQYDAGVWYKKTAEEREAATQKAKALVLTAERLWPKRSSCKEAANYAQTYVNDLNSYALVLEGKRSFQSPGEMYSPMVIAVSLGERRASCYEEVEALDQVKK